MSPEIIIVFSIIGVAAAMMASNRVRFDIVAVLVVLSLILSGILTPSEALAGFGSTVVILVAGLLVVGEMLDRTGVANGIGNLILKHGGGSETRLLVLIMIGAAVLGAVMSSTAVVAIFIPIVLRIAKETKLNASRILLPMSYAALISGMLTLIATTPNLVISEELVGADYEGFGFFSFTLVGFAVLAIAIVYVLFFGRRMLASESQPEINENRVRSILGMWEEYRIDREMRQLRVGDGSQLGSKTLAELNIQNEYGVLISGIKRQKAGKRWLSVDATTEILSGDTIIAAGKPEELDRMQEEQSMVAEPYSTPEAVRRFWEIGAATVMVHAESALIGKSLCDLEFRSRYGLQVFGLRRNGEAVADYETLPLESSDFLLVIGPWRHIQQLQTAAHDFVMLELPAEKTTVIPAYMKMSVAIMILAAMVLLSVFDIVPLVAAVIMAVMAGIFTRCITIEDSYRAIPWSSLVLVAGMLPLADALEKTGGTKLIVDALMGSLGGGGPVVVMSALFFLTAALGLFLSNTAAAVLVAPIAITSAEALGVSPYPFALAVLIAASAAFMTPVSTPVVTLVVEPGQYRFMDFVKVGVPLLILTYLVTVFLAPLMFPFTPK